MNEKILLSKCSIVIIVIETNVTDIFSSKICPYFILYCIWYVFPFERASPFFELLNRIIVTLLSSIVTMSVCFARGFGQIQNFNKGS